MDDDILTLDEKEFLEKLRGCYEMNSLRQSPDSLPMRDVKVEDKTTYFSDSSNKDELSSPNFPSMLWPDGFVGGKSSVDSSGKQQPASTSPRSSCAASNRDFPTSHQGADQQNLQPQPLFYHLLPSGQRFSFQNRVQPAAEQTSSSPSRQEGAQQPRRLLVRDFQPRVIQLQPQTQPLADGNARVPTTSQSRNRKGAAAQPYGQPQVYKDFQLPNSSTQQPCYPLAVVGKNREEARQSVQHVFYQTSSELRGNSQPLGSRPALFPVQAGQRNKREGPALEESKNLTPQLQPNNQEFKRNYAPSVLFDVVPSSAQMSQSSFGQANTENVPQIFGQASVSQPQQLQQTWNAFANPGSYLEIAGQQQPQVKWQSAQPVTTQLPPNSRPLSGQTGVPSVIAPVPRYALVRQRDHQEAAVGQNVQSATIEPSANRSGAQQPAIAPVQTTKRDHQPVANQLQPRSEQVQTTPPSRHASGFQRYGRDAVPQRPSVPPRIGRYQPYQTLLTCPQCAQRCFCPFCNNPEPVSAVRRWMTGNQPSTVQYQFYTNQYTFVPYLPQQPLMYFPARNPPCHYPLQKWENAA